MSRNMKDQDLEVKSFRITPNQHEKVKALAKQHKLNASEMIRRLIDKAKLKP